MLPTELPEVTSMVAFDTEGSGLYVDDGARVSAVSVAWFDDAGEIQSHAWPFDQGELDKTAQPNLLELMDDPNLGEQEWRHLCGWLSRRHLVAHNAKHDLHQMRAGTRHKEWGGVELIDAVQWDTMIGNKELDPLHPTGLDASAKRLNLGAKDDEQLKQWLAAHAKRTKGGKRYDMAPWDVIGTYAKVDAEITLRLWAQQVQRMGDDRRLFDREMRVMKLLYLVEQRGIGFDVMACTEAAMDLEAELERLSEELPFTPNVPGAKQWFFEKQKIEPIETTEGGEPQLNDSVVRKLVKRGVQWAPEYSTVRKIQVALDMWYRGYPEKIGPDDRLRTSFRQTKEQGQGGGGAVSGRYSVQRVNLQAIPHAHRLDGLPKGTPTPRQFFQAKDGHALWELDLQQAELRVAAKMANCSRMLEMIEAGEDLHGYTTKELFGIGPEHPDWFTKRQIGKRGNFSLIFAAGPDTFREMIWKESSVELTRVEANEIVQGWRRLYPEFGRAVDTYDRQAKATGYVELRNGRKRWFYPNEYTHKAFNQRVQGSLAEFAKTWALATERVAPGALVLLIHDSEVLELEIGTEQEVLEEVAAIGTKMGTKWFDVAWGVDYGPFGEH